MIQAAENGHTNTLIMLLSLIGENHIKFYADELKDALNDAFRLKRYDMAELLLTLAHQIIPRKDLNATLKLACQSNDSHSVHLLLFMTGTYFKKSTLLECIDFCVIRGNADNFKLLIDFAADSLSEEEMSNIFRNVLMQNNSKMFSTLCENEKIACQLSIENLNFAYRHAEKNHNDEMISSIHHCLDSLNSKAQLGKRTCEKDTNPRYRKKRALNNNVAEENASFLPSYSSLKPVFYSIEQDKNNDQGLSDNGTSFAP